jgi:hypothetical protein
MTQKEMGAGQDPHISTEQAEYTRSPRTNRPHASNPPKVEWKYRVAEKCKDCAYDPYDRGNWVQQVTACEAFDCPLWIVRPVSVSLKDVHQVHVSEQCGATADALDGR